MKFLEPTTPFFSYLKGQDTQRYNISQQFVRFQNHWLIDGCDFISLVFSIPFFVDDEMRKCLFKWKIKIDGKKSCLWFSIKLAKQISSKKKQLKSLSGFLKNSQSFNVFRMVNIKAKTLMYAEIFYVIWQMLTYYLWVNNI